MQPLVPTVFLESAYWLLLPYEFFSCFCGSSSVYRVVPVAAVQLIERLKKDIRMIIPV